MTPQQQPDSQQPTCLCHDPVFFEEPCPAHPKPDSQARDELDAILWDELGIDLNAHPVQKAKLQAYAERLATERALEELETMQHISFEPDYDPGHIQPMTLDEYLADRIATLKETSDGKN